MSESDADPGIVAHEVDVVLPPAPAESGELTVDQWLAEGRALVQRLEQEAATYERAAADRRGLVARLRKALQQRRPTASTNGTRRAAGSGRCAKCGGGWRSAKHKAHKAAEAKAAEAEVTA